jgi:hypothetical protein
MRFERLSRAVFVCAIGAAIHGCYGGPQAEGDTPGAPAIDNDPTSVPAANRNDGTLYNSHDGVTYNGYDPTYVLNGNLSVTAWGHFQSTGTNDGCPIELRVRLWDCGSGSSPGTCNAAGTLDVYATPGDGIFQELANGHSFPITEPGLRGHWWASTANVAVWKDSSGHCSSTMGSWSTGDWSGYRQIN